MGTLDTLRLALRFEGTTQSHTFRKCLFQISFTCRTLTVLCIFPADTTTAGPGRGAIVATLWAMFCAIMGKNRYRSSRDDLQSLKVQLRVQKT